MRLASWLIIGVLLVAAVSLALARVKGERELEVRASVLTHGNPHHGKALINRYGCGSCHEIEGVAKAHGLVGPKLDGIGTRVYIAGVVVNTPDNLIDWIKDPKSIDDKTAMPNLGVTDADARDIAAYLYTVE